MQPLCRFKECGLESVQWFLLRIQEETSISPNGSPIGKFSGRAALTQTGFEKFTENIKKEAIVRAASLNKI